MLLCCVRALHARTLLTVLICETRSNGTNTWKPWYRCQGRSRQKRTNTTTTTATAMPVGAMRQRQQCGSIRFQVRAPAVAVAPYHRQLLPLLLAIAAPPPPLLLVLLLLLLLLHHCVEMLCIAWRGVAWGGVAFIADVFVHLLKGDTQKPVCYYRMPAQTLLVDVRVSGRYIRMSGT